MNVENKYGITIGADPEIFISDGNEIVSAEGLTEGGTKYLPKPISEDGHAIQEDGIMFEYNIPPCTNTQEWYDAHKFCQDYLEVLASAHGYVFSKKVSDEINYEYLQTIQAKTFGCDPDYNVYLEGENPKPNEQTNLRCAGGHVAIGYPNSNVEQTEQIVKMFDMYVTLPALFKDNDTRRRELYGKAGSFRFKDPWGLECRALSNFWIHSRDTMDWVFNQTLKAVNCVLDGNSEKLIEKYSLLVREAIDTNNLVLAEELLTVINITEKVEKITT
jgi:hypothetical protein